MIPISDPKSQLAPIQEDILAAIKDVIQGGQYIMGPNVRALEQSIAKKIGASEAIAVGNGTDALVLTLEALGIGKGDEVITTPFSFFATAEAISRVGAVPVFVDVDQETFNMNPNLIRKKISADTKAILPVHLFGLAAEMDSIMEIANEHGLYVIEDACQAFGAMYKGKKVGSIGDAACFSFFPTKNLSTIGDGGIITTSNPNLAKKIHMLKAHGSQIKYYHEEIGYNSRLDEIHAAILRICLKKIDNWNKKRISLAKRYSAQLQELSYLQVPNVPKTHTHVFHLYCIESEARDEIISYLKMHGIASGVYYPRCIHLQTAYRNLGYQQGDFPVAERLSEQLFAIPLYPGLSYEQQDIVINTLKNYGGNR